MSSTTFAASTECKRHMASGKLMTPATKSIRFSTLALVSKIEFRIFQYDV